MNRGRGRGRNRDDSGYHSPRGPVRGRGRGRDRGRGGEGGRSSRSDINYAGYQVKIDDPLSHGHFGSNDGFSSLERKNSGNISANGVFEHFDHRSGSNHPCQQGHPLPTTEGLSSKVGELNVVKTSPKGVVNSSEQPVHRSASPSASASASASERDWPSLSDSSNLKDKVPSTCRTWKRQIFDSDYSSAPKSMISIFKEPEIKNGLSSKGSQHEQTPKAEDAGHSKISNCQPVGHHFDICPASTGTVIKLKAPLHLQNRMKRDELKRTKEGHDIRELRSGMLLLKRYLKLNDQKKIVKSCRDLGLGSGGFYEPSYRDGGKLHLRMMCLGKNWDPETSMYGDLRPTDGVKPPQIPVEFYELVRGAIQDSHSFLKEHSKVHDVEHVLPSLSPNICIVNFYTNSGRLGLHQDKDETPESLAKKLPVVSFSIGDSAEFLYNDQRDVDSAEKVTLESGDVLIFGGKARDVYHGVTSILSDTAPKALLEETNLRPGRLNLTFREY
ncbi:DNA oxidative demethylase [Bertholletia excelsa]